MVLLLVPEKKWCPELNSHLRISLFLFSVFHPKFLLQRSRGHKPWCALGVCERVRVNKAGPERLTWWQELRI